MESRQKHIMLFISALRKGGAERVMVTLAKGLKERGYRVTLVTQYICEDEYELPEDIPRIISEPAELKKGRVGNFIARYKKLRRVWKENKPDCILSFIGKNNFMAIMAAMFTGIPVIASVRGEPAAEYATALMRMLSKTLLGLADGLIMQTKEAIEFFPKFIRKKAVILKNPLNEAFVRPPFAGERNGQIVSVGRVDKNKNHEMIIRAFAQIAEEFSHSSLVIYGEGECRERLQQLAETLKLSDRILLPGRTSDIANKIYESSIFVLSSYSEGMPNGLLEAMCLGIPSVSTDCPCGGPGELIQDGVNGFLIPVGDVDALAEKMRLLLGNQEKARQISAESAKLLDAYEPEHVIDEWEAYLLTKMTGGGCK